MRRSFFVANVKYGPMPMADLPYQGGTCPQDKSSATKLQSMTQAGCECKEDSIDWTCGNCFTHKVVNTLDI